MSRRSDENRFLRHAHWVLENGCDALNVLGSTGEITSLSVDARAGLMRVAAKDPPAERLMVGTGAPSIQPSR